MISKKISLLSIGYNYQEINDIQDELSKEFSHFNFDFALSIRDSLCRLNISDYDIVLLDLASSDMDNMIALKEIYQKGKGIIIIVTVKSNEISNISNTFGINPHYFVIKDNNFIITLIDYIKDIVNNREYALISDQKLKSKKNYLFYSLINTVHDQVMIVGMDYRIKLFNNKVLERFNCSPQDIINKRCFEFFYNSDKPCTENNLSCPIKEILRTGKSCQLVHTYNKSDDDQIIQRNISALPLINQFNSPVEVLLTISEEEISQATGFDKKLLKTMIDGLSEGIFFCDTDNNIVLLNKTAEKLLNLDQEKLLNNSIFKLPLGKGIHWLSRVLESARSNIHLPASKKVQVNEKLLMLRFLPLYKDKKQYP